ncbi:MAG: TetR/AcrR family transcriptional regulator, partial [Azospirillaceae bacterium]
MARPLSYDRATVLEQAMQLFWRKGYERTSIRDLVDGTGLNPGSLYDGFGDKRAMFLAALEHYCDAVVSAAMAGLRNTRPGAAAVRGFFQALVDASDRERWGLGCLLVNTSVDASQIDADISDAVADRLSAIEAALHDAVARGQADGSIDARQPAEAVAAFLMTLLTGIRLGARSGFAGRDRIGSVVQV